MYLQPWYIDIYGMLFVTKVDSNFKNLVVDLVKQGCKVSRKVHDFHKAIPMFSMLLCDVLNLYKMYEAL